MLEFMQAAPYAVDMDETFGARLRRFRLAAGFGLKELGLIAGHSESWVSNLERGVIRRQPEYAVIVRWAELLDVTPSELASGAMAPGETRPEPLDVVLDRIGAWPEDDGDLVELDQSVAAGEQGGPIAQGDSDGGRRGRAQPRRYLVRVDGDCLLPDAKSGDYAVFDAGPQAKIGDIVVVADGEQALIKFLDEQNGVQYLMPHVGDAVPLRPGMRIVGVVDHFRRKPGRPPRMRRNTA
jgi:transcriptional regulator with XRE-family HTH domain